MIFAIQLQEVVDNETDIDYDFPSENPRLLENPNEHYLAEPDHSRETLEHDAEADRDLDYDDPVQRYS